MPCRTHSKSRSFGVVPVPPPTPSSVELKVWVVGSTHLWKEAWPSAKEKSPPLPCRLATQLPHKLKLPAVSMASKKKPSSILQWSGLGSSDSSTKKRASEGPGSLMSVNLLFESKPGWY